MLTLRVLLAVLCALATSAVAGAQVGSYHTGLGDDVPLEGLSDGAPFFLAPWASPEQPGCTTDLITTNFSSRGGVKPRLLVAHYTVSSNVAGWADVNAIRSWFNQSRSQSSSSYIIDAEGNCKLIVAETMKPWTQTVFNPYSISIEFIATGKESTEWWKTKALPGLKKGARVFADASKRWDIPIRWVNPVGCGAPPAGITDHDVLECNSHTDVKPNFPMGMFISLTKAAAQPPPAPKPTCRFIWKRNAEVLHRTNWTRCGSADERLRFDQSSAALHDRLLHNLRAQRKVTITRERKG